MSTIQQAVNCNPISRIRVFIKNGKAIDMNLHERQSGGSLRRRRRRRQTTETRRKLVDEENDGNLKELPSMRRNEDILLCSCIENISQEFP